MSPTLSFVVFVLAAALAAVGQLLVLRDGLAGRTPAAGAGTAARMREALWITIPAIALALTLWATWRALPARSAGSTAATTGPVATLEISGGPR